METAEVMSNERHRLDGLGDTGSCGSCALAFRMPWLAGVPSPLGGDEVAYNALAARLLEGTGFVSESGPEPAPIGQSQILRYLEGLSGQEAEFSLLSFEKQWEITSSRRCPDEQQRLRSVRE